MKKLDTMRMGQRHLKMWTVLETREVLQLQGRQGLLKVPSPL